MIIVLNLNQAKAVNHIWEQEYKLNRWEISSPPGISFLEHCSSSSNPIPGVQCPLRKHLFFSKTLPRLRFAVKPKNLNSCQTLESTRWVRQGGGRRRELGLSFPTIGISFRVQCPLTPPPLTAIICSVWTFNSPWGLFGFYHGTTIFVLKGISLLVQSSGFSRALPSLFYTCIPHPESSQCIMSPTLLIFVQVLSYLSTFRTFHTKA